MAFSHKFEYAFLIYLGNAVSFFPLCAPYIFYEIWTEYGLHNLLKCAYLLNIKV